MTGGGPGKPRLKKSEKFPIVALLETGKRTSPLEAYQQAFAILISKFKQLAIFWTLG